MGRRSQETAPGFVFWVVGDALSPTRGGVGSRPSRRSTPRAEGAALLAAGRATLRKRKKLDENVLHAGHP